MIYNIKSEFRLLDIIINITISEFTVLDFRTQSFDFRVK